MPQIAIIIPLYNCEKYISQAIQSVLSQPFQNIEIIIVNDGSKDLSAAIALEFSDKYPNIRVIDQVNQGASVARNTGIQAAHGEYLLFLDADDCLVPGCLDEQVAEYCSKRYDVMLFSSYGSNMKRNRYRIDLQLRDAEFAGGQMFPVSGHFGSGLYRKQFLLDNQIFFDAGVRLNEDQVFKIKALYAAKSIRSFARPLYIYNATPGSIIQTIAGEFDRVTAWRMAHEWFSTHAKQKDMQKCLSYVQVKLNSRMLLYAKSFVQSGHGRYSLVQEMKRVDGYDLLMNLSESQVMPYQKQELSMFRTDLNRFVLYSFVESLKISVGRLLLRIPVVRAWRDRKRYPLEDLK